uniref:Uncharacterized protein n=1 Tax=Candidatus Kentrum eta TaxID=2126337 RepID=A0A450U750_9GAMM|nr:MAG: hypothetical protein BECKH772A_GA0070896_100044 [Candidatus Kentron sp. H]VFJ89275.1 MAG: hypothetical protein BECKH772B_GA0070898_100044 [Candidatus Kentron sp. H]VFJ95880.1 MAG: hypothetical protein BECKH772C_GA0070978_100044 [Candidatus Kentron sp. H]
MEIQSHYIIGDTTCKVAVQPNIGSFGAVLEDNGVMEDSALGERMADGEGEKTLNLADAKKYYAKLDKAR